MGRHSAGQRDNEIQTGSFAKVRDTTTSHASRSSDAPGEADKNAAVNAASANAPENSASDLASKNSDSAPALNDAGVAVSSEAADATPTATFEVAPADAGEAEAAGDTGTTDADAEHHSPEPAPAFAAGLGNSHGHSHIHAHSSSGASRIGKVATWHKWRWVLMIFIGLWVLGTVFGLARMWPGSHEPVVSADFENAFSLGRDQVKGTVVGTTTGECSSTAAGTVFETSPRLSPEVTAAPTTDESCTWNIVQLDSGEDAGQRTLIINSGLPGEPELAEGDAVVLIATANQEGTTSYSFGDYQRSSALIIWGVLILLAILVLAGLRGVRSLVGLIFAIGVIVLFTLPALLAGFSPTAIAIITGALMLLPTVFLVHGWNWKAASSLGGTLAALAIAALLAYLAIEFANLRGLGDEENLQIIRFLPEVSVTGILLCGFIIGALGVLNDVTVAQASTVNELSELDPTASSWHLFTRAMEVGRDHITSMVYTLVLTYTGASMPVLLLLSVADLPLSQTLTSDVMATEFLRTGVGALALTLAVPLTTLFAAYTVPNRKIQQAAATK